MDGPKITKMDSFSLFQSETSIFHDEETSFMSFPGADKARMVRLQSPKFTILPSKKAMTDKHTHTHTQTAKIRSDQHIQNSNFRFKSRNCTRGSERCEKDHTYVDSNAVRLYRASKASCWHAGVLLAAPTGKR
jgi:hypothetical protein